MFTFYLDRNARDDRVTVRFNRRPSVHIGGLTCIHRYSLNCPRNPVHSHLLSFRFPSSRTPPLPLPSPPVVLATSASSPATSAALCFSGELPSLDLPDFFSFSYRAAAAHSLLALAAAHTARDHQHHRQRRRLPPCCTTMCLLHHYPIFDWLSFKPNPNL